jgi:nitrogen fixation/metabolism regulation signal transduction histidine kinase
VRSHVLGSLLGASLLAAFVAALCSRALGPSSTSLAAAAFCGSALGIAAGWLALRRAAATVDEVRRGLVRLREHDRTAQIDASGPRATAALARGFNDLAAALRAENDDLEQRERLIRTVADAVSAAIVLLDGPGRIVYANGTARDLFFEGQDLQGHNFLTLLAQAPAPFREALLGSEDSLFSVEAPDGPEVYHLAKRHFELNGEEHLLVTVKHVTREIRRQEVDVWKKLIRVISHELNNSIAPIASLVASARLLARGPDCASKLERVFDTIEDRSRHLSAFLEGYAKLARLPNPRRQRIRLGEMLEKLRALWPDATVSGPADAFGFFDPVQVEQALINLVKNAEEAGGPRAEIRIDVAPLEGEGIGLTVSDRGAGMTDEVMRSALLPFYSTKERGTGVGLPLCREIVEAHGGKLRIETREGGGTRVACSIPGMLAPMAPTARLTLSRV